MEGGNAIEEYKPYAVLEHEFKLTYDLIDGSNNFIAGNEFRQFDTRSIKTGGMGVSNVNRDVIPRKFTLYKDKPLNGLAYTYRPDIDGRFVIQNYLGDDDLSSDYVNVKFELILEKIKKPVFIFGQLSDWKLDKNFLMKYDESSKSYKKEVLLKQGHYNYMYGVSNRANINTQLIDGSHNETRNTYMVLVYHRPFGEYHDKVIGFSVIK